jgi:putative glutamine amidotransferase
MPLIAVSMTRGTRQETGVPMTFLYEAYTRALGASGVTPLLIPSTLGEDALRELYERVDGIVLTGGGDVNPSCSGLEAADDEFALATEIDESRDFTEMTLARWAYEEDKPLFGICRGHQVMNVALGGTLLMDIPHEVGTAVTHSLGSLQPDRMKLLHTVEVENGSCLSKAVGSGTVSVNSIHHQAVRDLAPGLHATAHAPDGIIESIEAPGARYFLGVQWHPEELFENHPAMRALFQSFADSLR